MKFLSWLMGTTCEHACYYFEDMHRREDGMVEGKCYKCGIVLVAEYGLALDCKLEQRPTVTEESK